ncbi:MAG: TonB family protein [Spirochaetota bacterium]
MSRDVAVALLVSLLLHAAALGTVELVLRSNGSKAAPGEPAEDEPSRGAVQRILVFPARSVRSDPTGSTSDVSRAEAAERRDLREARPSARRGTPSDDEAEVETSRGSRNGGDSENIKEDGRREDGRDSRAPDDSGDPGAAGGESGGAEEGAGAEKRDARRSLARDAGPVNTPFKSRAEGREEGRAEGREEALDPPAETTSGSPEPRLAEALNPDYPLRARRLGREGAVGLRVLVAPTGEVLEATVTEGSGHSELDEAARRAAASASFVPSSRLMPVAVRLRVVFRLE